MDEHDMLILNRLLGQWIETQPHPIFTEMRPHVWTIRELIARDLAGQMLGKHTEGRD